MEKELTLKILDLAEILSTKNTNVEKAVIGLDGFVDEILHVVATRKSAHEYERLRFIREYGEKIIEASGLSTNIEMVKIQVKLGGNGPILCNALASLGVSSTCIGNLGYPNLDKVFEPMLEICDVISISNPGHTDAVEFEDGKLIIGKHDTLKEINWDNIKKIIGIPKLISLISDSKLLGLENWTMLPYMNQIWRGLIDEVFPHLTISSEKRYVFFDLADPQKRTKEDILEAISLIKSFGNYFEIILGLNLKEALEIAKVFGFEEFISHDSKTVDLKELVKKLATKLDIYSLVVHPTIEAATVINGSYYYAKGPFTPKPKLTTGAGDNFNAGFCLGQMLKLDPEQSLLLGVATSGFYVRNAKSPNLKEIIHFLKMWSEDNV